jgi:hypothetical protein
MQNNYRIYSYDWLQRDEVKVGGWSLNDEMDHDLHCSDYLRVIKNENFE